MNRKTKKQPYLLSAMLMALPLGVHAQTEKFPSLDSLVSSGSVSVVEPDLLKKGVVNNALDALSGKTAGVNVTSDGVDCIITRTSVPLPPVPMAEPTATTRKLLSPL